MMHRSYFFRSFLATLSICLLLASQPCSARQDKVEGSLPTSWSEKIDWRSIGPANMMGRITSIAVYEKDTNIWWASSASGGLLKTTNNGVTFEHQFDKERTVSIGDVQVSKTDPDLLWVGTGESNPRNSVSWGDGVYKSTDGGKSWKNMGLNKIFQTGRIAIHPENHDIVYVGALGRLWGPNEERGLYKTADGGKTWEKIFYVDDKTGVIDVQMNPVNPDELLIATYERQRDGFDGNDPVKKYGEGSAIYKTVDAGKTFTRLTKGLPSCKLGRIGLNYFLKDPNVIAAIIESEKIAQEPENAAYAGIRGEDADVGAKITQVTKDGPGEKAGLKENDIVVSINGDIVYSYNDLLKGIRKSKAGETAKLVVSRDRKPVDVAIELTKRPAPRNGSRRSSRSRRSAFTGTLGGQAANLQGQQGENESEYGGVYLSKDGGESWERINTLNPRPMYYSQVRIDPVDMKNMYVLGTSLYRSKDGGETFTGDGGRGIHVDHHALWIDPANPRHMILGNDGGIYVTYDRMDNWDHHNHAALGQFYHVGINSRKDYHVFGGLQDNGSWGGPARVSNDSGPVNTDWYRVGGGDGFITLADPDDPDQIYFESQNGAMGRINLRTGERGFIRPRAPRGTRYRFNWKTPFILSPHNSKIHYSAGNYVFRSYNKGNGVKAISPEITNTDRGAGSAITESPVQPGVLYVGTTDGAVWMTKDGGNEWVALYSRKENKSEKDSDKEPEKKTEEKSDEKTDASKPSSAPDKPVDLNGTWNGKMISDRFPAGQAPTITFTLKSDADGKVSGEIETRRGPQEISSGQFKKDSGELTIKIETERGSREFTATVKGNSMTGQMSMRNGQFQVDFEAEKQEDPSGKGDQDPLQLLTSAHLMVSALAINHDDDPISGTWDAVVRAEQVPDGEIKFSIEFEMDSKNAISGIIESPQGEVEIEEGQYNPETKKLYFNGENDDFYLDFEAVLDGKKMTGDVTVNEDMTAEFEASLNQAASSKSAQDEQKTEEKDEPMPQDQEQPAPSQRGFLGVQFAQSSDKIEIVQIIEGSGAEKAGLQSDDVLISVDDQDLADINSVVELLGGKKAGDSVTLKIERDGETKTLTAELGEFPQRLRGQPQVRPRRPDQPSRPPVDEGNAETKTEEDEKASATTSADDKVSGTWEGTMTSPQGDRDLKLVLKQKSPKEITGVYETSRGERDINEGTYDAKSNKLTLVSESEQFTLEFIGDLSDDTFAGEIEFNGGSFTMDFEVKRTGGAKTASSVAKNETEKDKEKSSGKSLADLMPGPRWVSSLHASKYKAERCYISFDGHRSNDNMPHVFVTEDFGKSWNSLRANLPDWAGSVRVVREDLKNENILYLGCEFGAWVSIDRGKSWTKFQDMPTVAVHEFAQHPTLDDVVAGTHGRSLWVGDVSLLRQTSKDSVSADFELYKPREIILWRSEARRGSSGTRKFVGENPSSNASIVYSLGKNARSIAVQIKNLNGDVIKRFEDASTQKGLHVLSWDLRSGASSNRGRFGPRIGAGKYLVEMRVDGQLASQVLSIINDPNSPQNGGIAETSELDWWIEFGEEIDD